MRDRLYPTDGPIWHVECPVLGQPVGLVAGIVVLVPMVTGERGYFTEMSHPLDRDHPEIMIDDPMRGGL